MAIVFGLLAFGFMSVLLFGGPLQAIAFLTIWSDRLGMAYWPALILVAIVLAAFLTKYLLRFGLPRVFLPATFVVTTMLFSALLVGTCAVMERNRIIQDFEPDRLCCTNPVGDSSRESSVVAGGHEQTHTPRLQDQELARL